MPEKDCRQQRFFLLLSLVVELVDDETHASAYITAKAQKN